MSFLRPFAVTGLAAVAIPTSASTKMVTIDELTGEQETEIERHPDVLEWGFALEYSVIYLQEQVKDIGLRAPFDRLIPLVEFSFETPLNRGQEGETTGTINPGLIWSGKYFQIGAEAVIPVNSRTGNDVGFIAQLHLYLDDLFPHSLGRPLFWSTQMKRIVLGLLFIVLIGVVHLEAHAFLKQADPAVGSIVQKSPSGVRIWFTEKVEPAFSKVQVFNSTGQEVDKQDVHLDRSNHALLCVSLPLLQAGTYKVVWRVVSVDTHVTNGNFTFQIAR